MDFMNAGILQLVPKVLTVAQGLWFLGILKAAPAVGNQLDILGLPHRGQIQAHVDEEKRGSRFQGEARLGAD